MNKKICIAVAILLTCTSALLILHKESNVGATMSTKKITLCFTSYDPNEAWETNPEGMLCDGDDYARTTINGDVERLTEICSSGMGSDTITKVELRTKGCYCSWGDDRDIILRPIFPSGDGNNHTFDAPAWPGGWSEWFNITNDKNAPSPWTWSDVFILDCDVEAENNPVGGWFMLLCSNIKIRVTYGS